MRGTRDSGFPHTTLHASPGRGHEAMAGKCGWTNVLFIHVRWLNDHFTQNDCLVLTDLVILLFSDNLSMQMRVQKAIACLYTWVVSQWSSPCELESHRLQRNGFCLVGKIQSVYLAQHNRLIFDGG